MFQKKKVITLCDEQTTPFVNYQTGPRNFPLFVYVYVYVIMYYIYKPILLTNFCLLSPFVFPLSSFSLLIPSASPLSVLSSRVRLLRVSLSLALSPIKILLYGFFLFID